MAANAELGETIRGLQRQHADSLTRLRRTVSDQREALSGLERALGAVDAAG